ncbi:MAG: hypothetical protein QE279_03270 [Rhodoferax sp.]|nr:hypothetical protein [Rhodoferax sp.]
MSNRCAHRTSGLVRLQRGAVSILELIFVLTVSSFLAVYALNYTVQAAEDGLAASTGAYLRAATAAAQRYSLANFDTLQDVSPTVPGFANPFSPTLTELKAAGFAAQTFAEFTPSQQVVRFDYIKTGTCPGVNCTITAMTCTATPFAVRGKPREDLATTVMINMNGQGGRSQIGAGNVVRGSGAFIATANPLGNVEGIVCGQDVLDASLYDRFVKINDTRDINLKGNLTVEQSLGAGKGTDATGASCTLGGILSSGEILSRSATCVRLAWMGQDASGNGQLGLADSTGATRMLLGGDGSLTSSNAAGLAKAGIKTVAGESQVFADNVLNNAGNASILSDGTVNAQKLVSNALTLNNTVSLGGVCAPDGSAAWASSAGRWTFARCSGGAWTSVGGAVGAVAGAACSPYGAKALDANGAELMCTGGQWQLTTSRLGRYVLYASYNTVHLDMVAKPSCTSGATGSTAYMAVGSETISKFQRANRYLDDNGTFWTVRLFDETGAALEDANVIVLTYCIY